MIGNGDYFQAQVNYSQGASGYVNASYANTYSALNGATFGFGIISDSVYGGSVATGSATSVQLTTAWGVNAAYEHFWNPHWQTSVYGAYQAFSYNGIANGWLCTAENTAIPGSGVAGIASAACNNNFNVWNIGTRTQFNIDSQTYLGVDVVYQSLQTASSGMTTAYGSGAQAGAKVIGNQSAWMAEFRVHRNFYP